MSHPPVLDRGGGETWTEPNIIKERVEQVDLLKYYLKEAHDRQKRCGSAPEALRILGRGRSISEDENILRERP